MPEIWGDTMNSGGSADKPIITLSEPIKIDFPVTEREKEFDEYLERIEKWIFGQGK